MNSKISISIHPQLHRLPEKHEKAELATKTAYDWKETTLTLSEFAEHLRMGKGFGPIYKDGHRSKETVLAINYLALDFDQDVSISDVQTHPFISRFTFIAGATTSHTEEHPRTRVVFPLSEPVTDREQFMRLAERVFNQVKDLKPDESSKQAERFYFGCKDNVVIHEGELLSIAFIESLPIRETVKQTTLAPAPVSVNGMELNPRQQYVKAGIDREIEAFRFSENGNRNNQLYKAAAAIGSLYATGDSPYPYEEIEERLIQASYENGLSEDDGERATHSTIKGGFNAGSETPRDLSHIEDSDVDENLTQYETAQKLIRMYGHKLMYVPEFGERGWYIWNGFIWENDPFVERMIEFAANVAQTYFDEAEKEKNDKRKTALIQHGRSCQRKSGLNDILELAQTMPGISVSASKLNQRENLIVTQNGYVIDLRTGNEVLPSKTDYITQFIPVDYDPAAECPTWENAILEYMKGDDEMAGFIQRAMGYTLTGSTKEQVFFVMHGSGSNGKSTFVATIHDVLGGEFSKKTDFSTFKKGIRQGGSATPHIAALAGKRFVFASEGDRAVKLDEAQIKDMVSGEPISARHLYQSEFEFTPIFKIWLSSNHKPIIEDTSHGMWRRVCLIPFERRFTDEEKDKNLLEKLKNEIPGILNWMIAGAVIWFQEGLAIPEKVKMATQEYRDEQNNIMQFINDRCDLVPGGRLLFKTFNSEYSKYCFEMGLPDMPGKTVASELRELGFTVERGTGNKTFIHNLSLSIE